MLISTRAGLVADDALASANVRIWHDANANARVDANELQATLSSSSIADLRGQFDMPAPVVQAFASPLGVLQFTSTGGSAMVLGQQVAVSGPVQYMSYMTHPIADSDTHFQTVLSPVSTLASHLFRNTLAQGAPSNFDADARYAEDLGFVAATLGVPMSASQLSSTAPDRGAPQRIIAERQMNALLNVLVALASGKSDASDPAASAQATAAMAQQLANYLVNHGSLDPADPAQLRLLLASVLPQSLAIDDALAAGLAPLMSAFALAADGDHGMALAAQAVLPQLASLMASLNAPMVNGTLDAAATQSLLATELERLRTSLQSALADGTPSAYARVIFNGSGAFIDRNVDGRLDDADKVGGSLVAANFGAGGNADLAANRVVISWQGLPLAAQVATLSALNANDRVAIDLDSANFANALDLKWAAADANALLKAAQDKGVKADLSLTARGAGAVAKLSVGKLPEVDATQGVTAQFGAIAVLAAGNLHGVAGSEATFIAGLGGSTAGSIAGPVRVQAAGAGSKASFTAFSNHALGTADVAAVTTGFGASANAVLRSAADRSLTTGALSSVSHGVGSDAVVRAEAGSGGATASSASAHAAGAGSTATIELAAAGGGLKIGATSGSSFVHGDVSAIASGSVLTTGDQTRANLARVELVPAAGSLAVGATLSQASGLGSRASIVLGSGAGAVVVNGAAAIEASGMESLASIHLSGKVAGTSTAPAVQMAGLSQSATGLVSNASTYIAADGGTMAFAGPVVSLASGGQAVSEMQLAARQSAMSFSGSWTQSATGYGALAITEITRQGNVASALNFGQALNLTVTGANAGASLWLQAGSPAAGGDVSVHSIQLNAAGSQLIQSSQIDLSLVTESGQFTSSAGMDFRTLGANALIEAELGSRSGAANIFGMQQHVGKAGSLIIANFIAGEALGFGSGIHITATDALTYAGTTFDAGTAFSIAGPQVDAGNAFLMEASGYGSGTDAVLNVDGANVEIDGRVRLYRDAGTGAIDGARDFTQLSVSTLARDVDISGPLELVADDGAVNARVQATLNSVSGHVSLGSALIESQAFNSSARLNVHLTRETAVDAVSQFAVAGDFELRSTAAGTAGAGNRGAIATVIAEGPGASYVIGGDLGVQADGDLAYASALLEARPVEGAVASRIDGGIAVQAVGVGSTAAVSLAGASTLSVGGDIALQAVGLGAQAVLDMANLSDFDGQLTVTAGSAQASGDGGAYARVSVQVLSDVAGQVWVADPVHALDIAVLDISSAVYGGSVQLGTAGSTGVAYLQLRDAMTEQVDIAGSLGRAVVALHMEDEDFSASELKAGMMSLSGFRQGIDKFRFDFTQLPAQAWQGFISVGPGTVEAQLDEFLQKANFQLSGFTQGGYTATLIGQDEYIAFDYDGIGVTGLIKLVNGADGSVTGPGLAGVLTVPQQLSLDVTTISQTDVSDAGSESKSAGDISRGAVAVSASALQRNTFDLTASAGQVSTGHLTVGAGAYRSTVVALLNAGGATSNVTVGGNLQVAASGVGSTAEASLTPGAAAVITGDFTASASAAQSIANVVLFNAGTRFEVGGTVSLEAAGDYGRVMVLYVSPVVPDGATEVDFQSAVSLRSTGLGSSVQMDLGHSGDDGQTSMGQVRVEAVGDESEATLINRLQTGEVLFGADLIVHATGAGAAARVETVLAPSSSETRVGKISTAGQLEVHASGARSSASTLLSSSSGKADLTLGGMASAFASGYLSSASIDLSTLSGALLLPALLVEASGVGSTAEGRVVVAEALFDPENNPEGASGDGDLAIAGNVSVYARALGAQAGGQIGAYNGDLSIGSLRVEASAGSASLDLQAGTLGRAGFFILNASTGKVSVAGDVLLRATGAESAVTASMVSHNEGMSFGASLKVIAAGENSSAGMEAEATSNHVSISNLLDVSLLPSVPLTVSGEVAVLASNAGADANLKLSTGRGELRVGGNVGVQATGERATSAAELAGYYANLVLGGDVSTLASGDHSHAQLQAHSSGSNAFTTLSDLPGRINVAGNVEVKATGTNALSEIALRANPHNGVAVGKGVSVSAEGAGATATLALESATIMSEEAFNEVTVAERVRLLASSVNSTATANLEARYGDVSIGGLSVLASGTESQTTLHAKAADTLGLLQGGLDVQASGFGSRAEVELSSSAGAVTVNGGVSLIASGEASQLDVALTSAARLTIMKDVRASALADGSEVNLTLSQSAGPTVSVAGHIRVAADSGVGAVSGATATADLTLGKFGSASVDLSLTAAQGSDHASVTLQLVGAGGTVKLGATGQRGTAELTLAGDTAESGNQFVEVIDVDFTGQLGHASVNFNIDQDNLTAAEITMLKVVGFRADADALHFGNLQGIQAADGLTTTLTGFMNSALEHFNMDGGDEAVPVTGVLVGGSLVLDKTFIAYDIDGSGITAIIELDNVDPEAFLNAYRTANGLG